MKRGPKPLEKCILAGHNMAETRRFVPSGKSFCSLCKKARPRWKEKLKRDKEAVRKMKLKAKWGLTIDAFNEMLEKQNHKCAICLTDNWGTPNAAVDHNHETGKIRGLLCRRCNIVLGMYEDNLDLFQKSISYLKQN
jgi:hypothetical protein